MNLNESQIQSLIKTIITMSFWETKIDYKD